MVSEVAKVGVAHILALSFPAVEAVGRGAATCKVHLGLQLVVASLAPPHPPPPTPRAVLSANAVPLGPHLGGLHLNQRPAAGNISFYKFSGSIGFLYHQTSPLGARLPAKGWFVFLKRCFSNS